MDVGIPCSDISPLFEYQTLTALYIRMGPYYELYDL